MTRQLFDRNLNDMQDKILRLGSVVEENLEKSVNALFTGNKAISQQLIDFDEWVNAERIEIMMTCLTLIATQQPTGPDMRKLAANMEIAGELERIHDYVKGIGKISLMLGDAAVPMEMAKLKKYLPQMAVITGEMLHETMAAFTHHDPFDLQPGRCLKMGTLDAPHDFVVSAVHGHVAVVPADVGRHGPVGAADLQDGGCLVDQLGLKFRLRSDHRVHDLGALLFQRDAQTGNFRPGFFLLPLQGVDPFIALDPHLIHGRRMAVSRILQVQGGES